MSHFPKREAMKKMRAKIKAFTEPRSKLHMDLHELVEGLNRKLQGFKNYYGLSSVSKRWLNRIDWYVLKRLALFNNKKRQRRTLQGHLEEVKKQIQHKLVRLAD